MCYDRMTPKEAAAYLGFFNVNARKMAQGQEGLGRIEPWTALYFVERADLVSPRLA